MSFVFATRGLYTLLNSAISGTTDIRCGVLTNAGTLTAAQIRDSNFVSDFLALSGLVETTPQYRQDIAGVALTEQDASDNVTLTATAPVIASVPAGQVWRNVFYYVEAGTDATRVMIGVDTPASTLAPNGGNVTLPALSVTISDTSP